MKKARRVPDFSFPSGLIVTRVSRFWGAGEWLSKLYTARALLQFKAKKGRLLGGDLSYLDFFYVWKNFRRHAPIAPRTPVPRRIRLDGSGVGTTGGGTGSTGLSVMVIVILL